MAKRKVDTDTLLGGNKFSHATAILIRVMRRAWDTDVLPILLTKYKTS